MSAKLMVTGSAGVKDADKLTFVFGLHHGIRRRMWGVIHYLQSMPWYKVLDTVLEAEMAYYEIETTPPRLHPKDRKVYHSIVNQDPEWEPEDFSEYDEWDDTAILLPENDPYADEFEGKYHLWGTAEKSVQGLRGLYRSIVKDKGSEAVNRLTDLRKEAVIGEDSIDGTDYICFLGEENEKWCDCKDSSQAGTPVSPKGGETEASSDDDSGDSVPVDLPCEVCKDPGQWETMILCDGGCRRGFHLECIDLESVPKGEWFCNDCKPEAAKLVETKSRERGRTVIDLTQQADSSQGGKTLAAAAAGPAVIDLVTPPAGDIYADVQAMHYLRTGELRKDLEGDEGKKELKRVAKRATNYKYAGGQLYRRPTTKHSSLRLCPEPAARQQIVQELHAMAHMGTKRVLSMLSDRYYWNNMSADVREVVNSCDACARKGLKLKKDPELQPIEPADIFRRIHIDCLGPMPKTARGNKWVCVAVDSFSKWPFAKAMADKSSSSTAQFLLENVIAEHGVPEEVLSDRGGEFLGEFSQLLDRCGVKHKMSSSYHPQGNGLAERMVQNILHALQRAAMHDPNNWDLELPWILLAQRAVKCGASTKYSPAMMVFGRELVLPTERKRPYEMEPVPDKKTAEQHEMDLAAEAPLAHETVEQLRTRGERLNKAAEEARANIEQAQEVQKAAYKKRRGLDPEGPSVSMPPNSMVLMKAPARNKLSSGCEGPYLLVEWAGQSRALISDAEGKKWWTHASRLSPYGPATQQRSRTVAKEL